MRLDEADQLGEAQLAFAGDVGVELRPLREEVVEPGRIPGLEVGTAHDVDDVRPNLAGVCQHRDVEVGVPVVVAHRQYVRRILRQPAQQIVRVLEQLDLVVGPLALEVGRDVADVERHRLVVVPVVQVAEIG